MADLSRLGAGSLGVWTRAQALPLLSPGQVDALVSNGTWQVLWRGVYADAGVVVSPQQRALAAVLATGGAGRLVGPAEPLGERPQALRAVASGRTAARVWRVPLIDDDDPATGAREHLVDDVAVDRSLPRQSFAGRLLRPRTVGLASQDVVRLPSGLCLTTPLRTLADCAQLLTHEALVCAIDDALHRERVTPPELERLVAARRGRMGGPALRSAVAVADGRAEAPSETLLRLLLLPVLPGLEPQVRLHDERGVQRARFDLGDRTVRLAVEADGKAAHAGTQMVAKDRRRDRWSEHRGWTTERVTWFELRRQQRDVVRRMVQRHAELAAAGPLVRHRPPVPSPDRSVRRSA